MTKHVEIPQLQIVEKTVEAAKHIQQERVKELRSKFEVGHYERGSTPDPKRTEDGRSTEGAVHRQSGRHPRGYAKTRCPLRRLHRTSKKLKMDPAFTQSEVPNITDDDEDWLEQESKKRKLPMPADAVSESRADESDFDRFDDLVLPSPERKTVFVNIALR